MPVYYESSRDENVKLASHIRENLYASLLIAGALSVTYQLPTYETRPRNEAVGCSRIEIP
jgi:hypothetical protein